MHEHTVYRDVASDCVYSYDLNQQLIVRLERSASIVSMRKKTRGFNSLG